MVMITIQRMPASTFIMSFRCPVDRHGDNFDRSYHEKGSGRSKAQSTDDFPISACFVKPVGLSAAKSSAKAPFIQGDPALALGDGHVSASVSSDE